jgi:predicted nucleotide-binding protein
MTLAAAAALASACAPENGDRQVLVSACTKEGLDRKVCECIAEAKQKHMDKDLFRAEVLVAQGKTEEAQAIAEKVDKAKQLENVDIVMDQVLPCAMDQAS